MLIIGIIEAPKDHDGLPYYSILMTNGTNTKKYYNNINFNRNVTPSVQKKSPSNFPSKNKTIPTPTEYKIGKKVESKDNKDKRPIIEILKILLLQNIKLVKRLNIRTTNIRSQLLKKKDFYDYEFVPYYSIKMIDGTDK